jgi:hypothetical protein
MEQHTVAELALLFLYFFALYWKYFPAIYHLDGIKVPVVVQLPLN